MSQLISDSDTTAYANVNELYLAYLLNGSKTITPSSYISLRTCACTFLKTVKGKVFLLKYKKYKDMGNSAFASIDSPFLQFITKDALQALQQRQAAPRSMPTQDESNTPTNMDNKAINDFNLCKKALLDEICNCWCKSLMQYGAPNSAIKTDLNTNLKKAYAKDIMNPNAKYDRQTITQVERSIIHALHMACAFLNWATRHGFKNTKSSWWVNTPKKFQFQMGQLGFDPAKLDMPRGKHPLDVMVEFESGPSGSDEQKVKGPYLLAISAKSIQSNNPSAIGFKNPSLKTVTNKECGVAIGNAYTRIRDKMIIKISAWIEEIDNFCETEKIKDARTGKILCVNKFDIKQSLGKKNIFQTGDGSTGNRAVYWANPAWICLYKGMLQHFRNTGMNCVRNLVIRYFKNHFKLETQQGQEDFKRYLLDVWLNSNAKLFKPQYVKVTGYSNSISSARAVVEDPLDNSKTDKILAGIMSLVPVGVSSIGVKTTSGAETFYLIKMRLRSGGNGGMWSTSLKFVGENWHNGGAVESSSAPDSAESSIMQKEDAEANNLFDTAVGGLCANISDQEKKAYKEKLDKLKTFKLSPFSI